MITACKCGTVFQNICNKKILRQSNLVDVEVFEHDARLQLNSFGLQGNGRSPND